MKYRSLFIIFISLFLVCYSFMGQNNAFSEEYKIQTFVFYDISLLENITRNIPEETLLLKPEIINKTINVWFEKHRNIKLYKITEISKDDKLIVLIWYISEK